MSKTLNLVKVAIEERNGQELEWKEEASPNVDALMVGGIHLPGNIKVTGGSDDPRIEGFTAHKGSVYHRTNGETYVKWGGNDTEWALKLSLSKYVIDGHTLIPSHSQLVLHRKFLYLLSGANLILQSGAEVRFDNQL